jgi:hypothetical protein
VTGFGDSGAGTLRGAVSLANTIGGSLITFASTGVVSLTGALQVGPATQFFVAAPPSAPSGTPFDVTVFALDAHGHVATGYAGTVTFSTSDQDPGVVLPADYTFTADDQGAHTFSAGVTLVTPGDQALTATDAQDGTVAGTATVTVTSPPRSAPGAPAGGAFADLALAGVALTRRTAGGGSADALDGLFSSSLAPTPAG